MVLDAVAKRQPGPLVPALFLLVTAAGAVVILYADILKLAQLAGALGAALGSAMLLAWWHPQRPLVRGAMPAFAVLLPGLMFNARFETFSEVPIQSFLLVAAAPLLLGIGLIPGLLDRPGRRWPGVVQAVAVLALIGWAVVLAVLAATPSTEDWEAAAIGSVELSNLRKG
jgi:hypothetical protein